MALQKWQQAILTFQKKGSKYTEFTKAQRCSGARGQYQDSIRDVQVKHSPEMYFTIACLANGSCETVMDYNECLNEKKARLDTSATDRREEQKATRVCRPRLWNTPEC